MSHHLDLLLSVHQNHLQQKSEELLICFTLICFFFYWHSSSFSLNALALLARCRGIRQSLKQAWTLTHCSRKKARPE